ncbi:MAG: bifunctional folylpolyglutamate synthase/dihydrofolate synthase [Eggerthellaceae bacterium]|nr:bifunctional folylpolyglutamate synthase/dihydrofolate synthase [Eggerthellaceae bacterium]
MAEISDFDPIAYINTPRWQQVELGLERIEELLERLGRPQDKLRFVHVAGTNGKGSVCTYIATTLQEAGYKTGLFTSPYIERFEERIRVNGENIPLDNLTDVTLAVREQAEAMDDHPTEFELMCAVAFEHFARQDCDIVVAEVGLGGRFDATNVIVSPDVCVICRLGLDHTAILGDTLAKIAFEKAGIIKPGTHVISWPQEPEAIEVIERVCAEKGATLQIADFEQLTIEPLDLRGLLKDKEGSPRNGRPQASSLREFTYRGTTYHTQLIGNYQPSNATLAIDALHTLRMLGWNLTDEVIERGIAETVWPARFEVCSTHPLFIVDGGHNPQGAQVMAQTLAEVLPGCKPVFVIGILADKDYPGMLESIVPLGSAFVCVTPPNSRALSADDLGKAIETIAHAHGDAADVRHTQGFEDAVVLAREIAGREGIVCAFGSLYSVASVKQALRKALGIEQ